MADLIEINNHLAIPSPYILTIKEFDKFWTSIIGTRGLTGKRSINASAMFNSLFEIEDNTKTNELVEEDFSEEQEHMLEVLRKHAQANVALHVANIECYLRNPAGIGEHSDIMEAMQGELDKIAAHEDRLDILNNYFNE